MDDSLPNQYAALKQQIDEQEGVLDGMKDRLKALEKDVLAYFERHATTSVKGPAGTVHLHRQTWSKIVEGTPDELVQEAFQEVGWGGMVKRSVNANSLSAAVRQMEADEKPLPPLLQSIIKTAEVFQVRVRK